MPSFGTTSRYRLLTCHPDLRRLFERVVEKYDCKVLTGHRDEADQNKAVLEGRSKLRFPDGNHNKAPSLAADVGPHPIDWDNLKRFYHFSGYVQGIANVMNIPIRWGGDWDRDYDLDDQTFNDLVHFELVGDKYLFNDTGT